MGASGNEYNRLTRGKMPSGQKRAPDRASMAYYRCFKDAFRREDPQRHEARFYEVNVLYLLFRFLQDHAFSQNDRLKVFSYCREFLKGNTGENPVFNKGARPGTDCTPSIKQSLRIGCLFDSCGFRIVAPAGDGQELVGHSAVRLFESEILSGQPLLTSSIIASKF